MDKQLPFVSVIVPTFHDWGRLKLCIDALANQTYPKNRFEVLIVNNDPSDPCPYGYLPDNIILITEGKPGSYAARNAGIKIAKGEILAFTDADCIPYSDWIEQGVNILLKGAKRVAGRIELFYKSDKPTIAEIYEKLFGFEHKKSTQTGGAFTANMITWKENFEKVGLFNDSLMSGGDNEWGWRAQDEGISVVYAPSVVVRHPARNSIMEILRRNKRIVGGACNIAKFRKIENKIWFFTGLVPPVGVFKTIFKRKDLVFWEKISTYMLFYFFKLHRTCYRSLLLIGVFKPTRQ